MKKELNTLDQINMLIKHANRNGIKVDNFRTYNDKCVYAECADGSYFTIYCFIDHADFIFKLV